MVIVIRIGLICVIYFLIIVLYSDKFLLMSWLILFINMMLLLIIIFIRISMLIIFMIDIDVFVIMNV